MFHFARNIFYDYFDGKHPQCLLLLHCLYMIKQEVLYTNV
jgi:hypothetical protein